MRKLTLVLLLLAVTVAFADRQKALEKIAKAQQAAAIGNLPKAEKLLREALKEDSTQVKAHVMLGDLLSQERRFSDAALEYTTALDLNAKQSSLSDDEKLQATDSQGVAYAESGNLPRAKEIYEAAIKQNPDYPLFYYNLACVYAEMHQLDPALENLKKAWDLRDKMPEGVRFPDPRKDTSFGAYLKDPRFQEAVRNMVF